MNLRHLRAFLLLATELNFSATAEALHLAQPALSRLIRNLEKDVGAELFYRTSRKVELSPAGESFRKYAIRAVVAIDQGRLAVRDVAEGRGETLRFGYYSTASYSILSRIRQALLTHEPDLSVSFEGKTSYSEVMSGIFDKALDAAIVRAGALPPSLGSVDIMVERPVVLYSKSSRYASMDVIRVSDLREANFITLLPAYAASVHSLLVDICHTEGFTPRIVQYAPDSWMISELVRLNSGITLTYDSVAARIANPEVEWKPLDGVDNKSVLKLIFLKENRNETVSKICEMVEGHKLFGDIEK